MPLTTAENRRIHFICRPEPRAEKRKEPTLKPQHWRQYPKSEKSQQVPPAVAAKIQED